MRDISKLLIDEPPLQVLPSLACAIGLNEAIVLQQLYWLLRDPRNGRRVGEHQWIFNTLEEWRAKFFPFWSVDTVKRTFTSLKKMNLVVSIQPEKYGRRAYYRIATERLVEFTHQGKLPSSSGQDDRFYCTKSTSEKSKETKETSSEDDAVYDAEWKPRSGSKEQKLKRLRVPKEYPSEQEFDAFLAAEDLDSIVNYRCDLYAELCSRKWHEWNERAEKWVPIRNWRKYVAALNETIETALE